MSRARSGCSGPGPATTNEVNLVAVAAALRALIPLQRKQDRAWREDIEAKVACWWQVMDAEVICPGY
jgi:pyruvate dehydrogenase (quinone)